MNDPLERPALRLKCPVCHGKDFEVFSFPKVVTLHCSKPGCPVSIYLSRLGTGLISALVAGDEYDFRDGVLVAK